MPLLREYSSIHLRRTPPYITLGDRKIRVKMIQLTKHFGGFRLFALASMAVLLSGCGRGGVEVYQIPKETATKSPPPEQAHSGMPHLHWDKLPAGWTEQPPTKMRAASFLIKGENDLGAEMAAMPFPGMGGKDLMLVNMWREQIGLAAVTDEELPKLTAKAVVAGLDGKLFDISGSVKEGEEKPRDRIIVALVSKDEFTWFFKLQGDAGLVGSQRPAFLDFLKNVTIDSADAHGPVTASAPPSARAGLPGWIVPANWKAEQPSSSMLLAQFGIAGDAGAGTVTVSQLGGAAGGLTANLNRWRGQLGLAPVSTAEAENSAKTIDVSSGKATFVELSGKSARTGQPEDMIVVMVPQAGSTWFYKLTGDKSLVAKEKEAMLKFVKTVNYN